MLVVLLPSSLLDNGSYRHSHLIKKFIPMKPSFNATIFSPVFSNQRLIAPSTAVRYLLVLLVLLGFRGGSAYGQTIDPRCDGNPADWANFTTTYPIHGYVLDKANASGNVDDQFTQGSKDGQQTTSWHWSNGSANAKGDITNAGVALTGTNNCVLRFFGDRTSNNGDASIGFWFFKSSISTNADGTFSGLHTNGDLLVLSDFTGGGTTPTITVYQWQNGGLVLASGGTSCAQVNHIAYPVPAGLTYTASNGATNYQPNLFYEGYVDLCSYNIGSCFASFLLETRNSQSITASLQDFALGGFNATPDAPAATVVQPTCTVATGTVNVTSPNSAYTYTLALTASPNTAYPATVTTGPPYAVAFNTVPAGAYTLTATQGACSNTGSVTVNAQPPTPGTPAATVVQPTCTVATGTVNVTSPNSLYTYTLALTASPNTSYPATVTAGAVAFNSVPAGTYTLTATQGACSNTGSVTVNAQPPTPARPVVTLQEATICGTNATPTVTVSCPVAGKYILKQTGQTDLTFTYTGSNGPVKFNVLPGLGGFTITVTTGITTADPAGCTSAATDCSNYTTNSCPQAMVISNPATSTALGAKAILTEAYPNPTGQDATINFSVPKSGRVLVVVYNALGARVATLFDDEVVAGEQRSVTLKGAGLQSGTYTYRVIANGSTKSNRISLIK